MLRLIAASILAVFCVWTAIAQSTPSSIPDYVHREETRWIDLNQSGTYENLKNSNPTHYRKISAILDGLGFERTGNVTHWIRSTFQAQDVFYSDFLLTTFPAQTDIGFTLDDTRYSARVFFTGSGAKLFVRK